MKASIRQIQQTLPRDKSCPWWVKLWVRKTGHYVTWVAVRLGLSANQISVFAIAVAVVGSLFLGWANINYRVFGAVLLNIWLILDCVDGDIARLTNTASSSGEFMDALGGYYATAGIYVGSGFGAWQFTGRLEWVIVGTMTSVLSLLSRLINTKAHLIERRNSSKGTIRLGKTIIENIEISGCLMPALLVATWYNLLHWLLVFYCAFWMLALIAVTVLSVRDAMSSS